MSTGILLYIFAVRGHRFSGLYEAVYIPSYLVFSGAMILQYYYTRHYTQKSIHGPLVQVV